MNMNINKPTKGDKELKKIPPLPKEEKKHPLPHEFPPHILKEIMDLKEKVGRLEGQIDILLRLKTN